MCRDTLISPCHVSGNWLENFYKVTTETFPRYTHPPKVWNYYLVKKKRLLGVKSVLPLGMVLFLGNCCSSSLHKAKLAFYHKVFTQSGEGALTWPCFGNRGNDVTLVSKMFVKHLFKAMTFEHWMVKDLTFYCWWMLINIHEHLVGNAIFWTLDQAFVFSQTKKHTFLGAHEGPLHSLTQGFCNLTACWIVLQGEIKLTFWLKDQI